MTLLGTTLADVTQIDIPANKRPFNSTIYWRVDTTFGGSTVEGLVWSFDAVKQVPIVKTDPAPLTVVNGGATVNLNVVATSATTPEFILLDKYEWFFVKAGGDIKVLADGVPVPQWTGTVDPLNPPANWGRYNCPLAIPNFQLAKEGEYYCVVTNRRRRRLLRPRVWPSRTA